MIRRYEAGEVLGQIAESYGMTQPTVARHLRRAGAPVRPRGRRPGVRGPGYSRVVVDDSVFACLDSTQHK